MIPQFHGTPTTGAGLLLEPPHLLAVIQLRDHSVHWIAEDCDIAAGHRSLIPSLALPQPPARISGERSVQKSGRVPRLNARWLLEQRCPIPNVDRLLPRPRRLRQYLQHRCLECVSPRLGYVGERDDVPWDGRPGRDNGGVRSQGIGPQGGRCAEVTVHDRAVPVDRVLADPAAVPLLARHGLAAARAAIEGDVAWLVSSGGGIGLIPEEDNLL
mmetsp:Transcript_16781/g.34404  ORF Transcript_16781/g.34404 Transcript_16781/m.34404 type:complete len:214 (-) Transcript_16781:787-1428(-)